MLLSVLSILVWPIANSLLKVQASAVIKLRDPPLLHRSVEAYQNRDYSYTFGEPRSALVLDSRLGP